MKYLFYLLLLCSSKSIAQLSCNPCVRYHKFIPTVAYPTNQQTFDIRFEISILEESVIYEGKEVNIEYQVSTSFDNKEALASHLACLYDFPELSSLSHGSIIEYNLSDNLGPLSEQFTLLFINNCGMDLIYMISTDGLHQLLPCGRLELQRIRSAKYQDLRVFPQSLLVHSDTTSGITIQEEVVFDTITEQVLTRESTVELEVIPANFDTVEMTIVYRENSMCPGAIYDTITEFVLVQDAYTIIEVQESVYETVTEQVLLKDFYPGIDYYIQDSIIHDTLSVTHATQRLIVDSLSEGCADNIYFDCLRLSGVEDTIIDTLYPQVIYPPCNSGYQQIGKYCFTDDGIVNATYGTRAYQKLVQAEVAQPRDIARQYISLEKILISNKEDLEDTCITTLDTTITTLKLRNGSRTNSVIIPSMYEARDYLRYVSGQQNVVFDTSIMDTYIDINLYFFGRYVIGSIERDVVKSVTECEWDEIRKVLFNSGYITALTVPLEDLKVGIAQYQLDYNLGVGLITKELLDHMKIDF